MIKQPFKRKQNNKNFVDWDRYEQQHCGRILKCNSRFRRFFFTILQASKKLISQMSNSHPWRENILRLCPFIKGNWEKVSPTRKFHLSGNWTEMARLKMGAGVDFSLGSSLTHHRQDCLELEKALMPSVLHQDQKTILNFTASFVNKFLSFVTVMKNF